MNAAEPPMDLAPPLIETLLLILHRGGPHGLFVARIYSFERLGARGIPGRYALCLFFPGIPLG